MAILCALTTTLLGWVQEPAVVDRRPWSSEDEHVGLGPFRFNSLSPFCVLRPGFTPRLPSTLREGDFEARAAVSWANVWAFNEDDWLIDYEVLYTSLSVAYRVSEAALFELELEDAARFGGSMDSLIINFHRAVGAEQRHRDDFPKNDFQFDVEPTNGQPRVALSNRDRGSFSETLLLSLQMDWLRSTEAPFALSSSASFRCELGDAEDLRGGSPIDVALSLSLARRFGAFHFYAGANFAWYGHEEFQGVELRTFQAAGTMAVEWHPRSRFSVVLEYLLTQAALQDPKSFRRPSNEIILGFKWRMGRAWLIEIAGMENFIIPDNSPDFGFHAGVTVRW